MNEQAPSHTPSVQEGLFAVPRVRRRVQIPNEAGELLSDAEWDARKAAADVLPENQAWKEQYNVDKEAHQAEMRAAEDENNRLLDSMPSALVESTDERYGPGTSLALARGEITKADLDARPTFIHASTGEQLGTADVKGKLASAAEQNQGVGGKLQAETFHIAEDFNALRVHDTDTVHADTVETEQGPRTVEIVELDPDHSVEVAYGEKGEISDVIVIASESGPDGAKQEHSVEVIPDTTTPDGEDLHPEVKIDGEPVDSENEITIASEVLAHTGVELDSMVKENSEPEVEPIQELEALDQASVAIAEQLTEQSTGKDETAEPDIQERPAPPTKEEQLIAQKKQVIGHTAQYMRGVPERVLQQVSQEAGIDLKELRERLATGEITLDAETVQAIRQLQQNGLKPGSPEWNTDPRNPSMIGRVAKESRQLLAEMMRQVNR